jgi:hypothetical protein
VFKISYGVTIPKRPLIGFSAEARETLLGCKLGASFDIDSSAKQSELYTIARDLKSRITQRRLAPNVYRVWILARSDKTPPVRANPVVNRKMAVNALLALGIKKFRLSNTSVTPAETQPSN